MDPGAGSTDDPVVRRRRQPLTKEESQVVEVWRGNGRTKGTIQVYLYWVRRFCRSWRARGRDPLAAVTLHGARDFAQRYAREQKIDETLVFASARSALRAWAFAVRMLGGSPPPWQDGRPSPRVRPLIREYCEFRRHHRGVAESTLGVEMPWITEFLDHLGAAGRPTSRIRLVDVDAFVMALRPRLKPKTIAGVCCALRSFLKFLTMTGRLPHDLACGVVGPRVVRRDRPPRSLPWRDVQRILAAVDVRTRWGCRNRAVLLLMAAYGMGAAEVGALRLDDLDWRAATLRITRPKTGASVIVPLLPPVARAVLDYLRRSRPSRARTRVLFLSSGIPHGPISASAIGFALRQYAQAAGVSAPALGAHSLRHSHATRQIDLGAPPKIVGDILGHRDPASTSAYVLVASRRLRPLALPVPR